MEKKGIKEMKKEERRNFLLAKLQKAADFVLWDIRDDNPEIMIDIKQYRQYYRLYRNIKKLEGQEIYNSPRVDINMSWESY